jgi:hypothetical protein
VPSGSASHAGGTAKSAEGKPVTAFTPGGNAALPAVEVESPNADVAGPAVAERAGESMGFCAAGAARGTKAGASARGKKGFAAARRMVGAAVEPVVAGSGEADICWGAKLTILEFWRKSTKCLPTVSTNKMRRSAKKVKYQERCMMSLEKGIKVNVVAAISRNREFENLKNRLQIICSQTASCVSKLRKKTCSKVIL